MNRRWMLALLSGTLLGTSLPREARAQLVVVVNPHNPVRNLSIEELRRLYLGRTTTFRQNQPVLLLDRATPPQAIAEVEDLKRVVAQNVGAIGFLDLSAADQSVKVQTINGPHPGDAGYPLRRRRL